MKFQHNEKGYALLLVLLLIVFISIISVVFLRGSLSNAKQERAVDDSHLTTLAAETGVEYYETLISNKYLEKVELVEKEAKTYLNNKLTGSDGIKRAPTPEDYSDTRRYAAGRLVSYLTTYVNSDIFMSTINLTSENNEYSFTLKPFQGEQISSSLTPTIKISIVDASAVVVSAEVIGKNKVTNLLKKLQFTQKFIIPSFDPSLSDNEVIKPPISNQYPGNVAAPDCPKNTKSLQNTLCIEKADKNLIEDIQNSSTVYFPNGVNNQKAKDFIVQNSAVYINKSVHLVKYIVIQNSTFNLYSTLKANGDFIVEGGNSTVRIYGDLTHAKILDVQKKALVRVVGNVKNIHVFNVDNEARFYIAGNLDAKDINIDNRSKVCVAGNINPGKTIEISEGSYIYYMGTELKNVNTKRIQRLDSIAFKEKCPNFVESEDTGGGDNGPLHWPLPKVEVNYYPKNEDGKERSQ